MWPSLWILPLAAAEILGGFRPAPPNQPASPYGPVMQVEFSTRLVELESGSLAHHLAEAMKNFRFPEKVWVVAYRTTIVDARGATPKENYLCHTFFSDQRVDQHQENELKGIYSDAFTPEVKLPAGYGLPLGPEDSLHWMPMFNNRGDLPARVAMKVEMSVIRDRDLRKPLRALYGSLRSVQVPHLYFVKPGRDERQTTFKLSFDGHVHFLGTHLHPYGASVELYNVTRGERVWIGSRTGGPASPMTTYSSAAGYTVHAGETYRITAIYDNPTRENIDAMAGLFMMYSRN